jgi:pyruvate/2-oxoglutarate dehydrogenase complex dihydrolipoamide dehydrogenase (E3) component
MGETRGFVKALVDVKTNRILGCTIRSVEAGEMLGTVQMASAGWRSPHCAMRPRNRGI